MKKTLLKTGALVMMLQSGYSAAAGFALIEQGVTGLGRAYAGSAAVAEDASTIFHNPAGLSYLTSNEFSAGLAFFDVDNQFSDNGSSLPAVLGGAPLTGPDSNGAKNALLPSMFYAHRLNDKFVAGIGIAAPFGLGTEFADNWKGRYHAIETDLKSININPSIAIQATDKLSVGFGVSAEYTHVVMSQAVDFGAVCAAAVVAGCAVPQGFDGKAKLKADDWGWGFNLGFIYQATDSTRIGMHYRSKIDHKLAGSGKFTVPNNPFVQTVANVVGISNGSITGDLTLPETLSFAVHHQVNAKWAVMADTTWTRWSQFPKLKIESATAALNSTKVENWENVMRYAIGVNYNANTNWTFRAGVAYDEAPIPNANYRTPRLADNDRKWVSLGASYKYSDKLTIDAGYAHLFLSKAAINDIDSNGYALTGDFDTSVDIYGLQLRWLM